MSGLPPIHRWDSVSDRAQRHILRGIADTADATRARGDLKEPASHLGARSQRSRKEWTPPIGLGHFGYADGWRASLGRVGGLGAHAATFPGLPLVLFAHSMGSFLGGVDGRRGTAYGVVL